jgi:hypothetical protein
MSGDLRVVRAIRVETDHRAKEAARPEPEPAATAGTVPPDPVVERDDTERVPVTVAPAPVQSDSETDTDPTTTTTTADDDARIEILRALERGEIDVTEAGRRLEALDDR